MVLSLPPLPRVPSQLSLVLSTPPRPVSFHVSRMVPSPPPYFFSSSFPALHHHQARLLPSWGTPALCSQGMSTQSMFHTPLDMSLRLSAPQSVSLLPDISCYSHLSQLLVALASLVSLAHRHIAPISASISTSASLCLCPMSPLHDTS